MPHSKPIIESIRDYLLTCDFLKDGKVNIDYLPDEMAYSIDPIGGDPIYRRYVDGDALRQFQFAITSKEAYDGDARTGIENSGFIASVNHDECAPIIGMSDIFVIDDYENILERLFQVL